MKNILILFIFFILVITPVYSQTKIDYNNHLHSEASYQHVWCSKHKGIEEYQNKDFTRVDCLTSKHAVEFDFVNKWAESIGQALYYHYMTGKRAKCVLILEYPQKQMCYFERVKKLSEIYDFDAEYVTTDILDIKNNKCPYPKCKCKHQ